MDIPTDAPIRRRPCPGQRNPAQPSTWPVRRNDDGGDDDDHDLSAASPPAFLQRRQPVRSRPARLIRTMGRLTVVGNKEREISCQEACHERVRRWVLRSGLLLANEASESVSPSIYSLQLAIGRQTASNGQARQIHRRTLSHLHASFLLLSIPSRRFLAWFLFTIVSWLGTLSSSGTATADGWKSIEAGRPQQTAPTAPPPPLRPSNGHRGRPPPWKLQ